MLRVNLKCQRSATDAGTELEQGRFIYLIMRVSEEWIPYICGYLLLDKGIGGAGRVLVFYILIGSDRMMYGTG